MPTQRRYLDEDIPNYLTVLCDAEDGENGKNGSADEYSTACSPGGSASRCRPGCGSAPNHIQGKQESASLRDQSSKKVCVFALRHLSPLTKHPTHTHTHGHWAPDEPSGWWWLRFCPHPPTYTRSTKQRELEGVCVCVCVSDLCPCMILPPSLPPSLSPSLVDRDGAAAGAAVGQRVWDDGQPGDHRGVAHLPVGVHHGRRGLHSKWDDGRPCVPSPGLETGEQTRRKAPSSPPWSVPSRRATSAPWWSRRARTSTSWTTYSSETYGSVQVGVKFCKCFRVPT